MLITHFVHSEVVIDLLSTNMHLAELIRVHVPPGIFRNSCARVEACANNCWILSNNLKL